MSLQLPDDLRDGVVDGARPTDTNGVKIVPVPSGLHTTIPTASEPALAPPSRPQEPAGSTLIATTAVAASSAAIAGSTGVVGSEIASAARETQTVIQSPPSNQQFLTMSGAVGLQVLVFIVVLAGLAAIFFKRRRKKKQWQRQAALRDTKRRSFGENSEPEFGYTATMLGTNPKLQRSIFQRLRQNTGRYRNSSAAVSSERPFELPTGPMPTIPTIETTAPVELHSPDLQSWAGTVRESVGAAHHSAGWLPGLPPPAALRIIPVHSSPSPDYEGTTPTLAEIREHLTHAKNEGPEAPPRALSKTESRWSATTRSSTFTASSHTSMAYVSALQPPPMPRRDFQKQSWAGSGRSLQGNAAAGDDTAKRTISMVEEEETVGWPANPKG